MSFQVSQKQLFLDL
jgi:two-component system, sensor histidine kinase